MFHVKHFGKDETAAAWSRLHQHPQLALVLQ
jgi:hypothetical protein